MRCGFAIEDLDEGASDGLALRLGVLQPLQGTVEFGLGIDAFDVEPEVAVALEHPLVFILTKQAVIHEDAVQLLSDGAVQQQGGHGAVHTAAQGQYHLVGTDLLL
jgi:hypothetical protein